MKEISKIIKCMDLVLLNGKINNIKVNGKIVEWMVMENSNGMMGEYILVNTKMIKKKEEENSIGLMENIIKDNGKMENNME